MPILHLHIGTLSPFPHTASQVLIFSLTGDGNRASVRSDVAGRPIFADLRHFGPSCAAVWRKRGLPLPKKKSVMFEIIISIGLYIGAIVLLVKGAIIYCEHCPE